MSISNRIVLITGANKGIGLETARQLGRAGHTVLVGARDAAKADGAVAELAKDGITAHAIVIDVTDADSIAKAAAEVEKRFGRVDSLINNAGIGREPFGGKTSDTKVAVWREIFETNLFGVVAVTQAFLPLVQKSAAGRIVNVSSALGSLALHADPTSPYYHFKAVAYDTSKTALNQYTVHLAYELRETNIKVNAGHPGWVKTDLGGEAAPMEVADGAKTNVYLATLPDDGPTGLHIHMESPLPW